MISFKQYIDLHIYSSYSDGQFTPQEIIEIAKNNNVDTVSITDHNDIEQSLKTDKCNILFSIDHHINLYRRIYKYTSIYL